MVQNQVFNDIFFILCLSRVVVIINCISEARIIVVVVVVVIFINNISFVA